ncbi:MAG: SDR family NAD(P)-dependent oxidoreductase [candidate division FCPU426 bacterium]
MPKAIIIGATSGIGWALAHDLARQGYSLGLAGRRLERLRSLQHSLPRTTRIQPLDVRRPQAALLSFKRLIRALGGLDLLVLSAGISRRQASWPEELEIIATNVQGFAAMARAGFDYFCSQGHGHLAGLSSISAIRGRGENVAYSASKAFVSNYLQGLRQQAFRRQLPITVTEILAGWVNTPLIRGSGSKRFWVAPVETASRQIASALAAKKSRVYVTRRWALIGWFLRLIPDWLHQRL